MLAPVSKRVAHSWTVFLKRFKLLVLVFWVILAVLGVRFGSKLNSLTSTKSDPIKGSLSAKADEIFTQNFPEQKGSDTELLLVQQSYTEGPDLVASGFLQDITVTVQKFVASKPHGAQLNVSGYGTGNMPGPLRSSFITSDNRSTFITFQSVGSHVKIVGEAMRELLSVLQRQYAGHNLFIGGTGGGLLLVEASSASQADTGNMDKTALPFALFILLCVIRSLRHMILPLLCMAIAILTALLVMYSYASLGGQVSSVAPAVMLSLQLALSIDYSLFLLTRFQEECVQPSAAAGDQSSESLSVESKVQEAVVWMLASSGKTILGSGATLCLCFLALLFFPVALMRSLGVAVLVAITAAIMVNLSLTPALLMTFPNFFAKPPCSVRSCFQSRWCCCRRRPNPEIPGGLPIAEQSLVHMADGGQGNSQQFGYTNPTKVVMPVWFRVARTMTSPLSTLLAAVVILAIAVPGLLVDMQMVKSTDMMLLAPRDGSVVTTNNRLVNVFQAGITTPYQLLLVPSSHFDDEDDFSSLESGSVFANERFWTQSQALLTQISTQLQGKNSINSLMYTTAHGNVSQSAVQLALGLNCSSIKNQSLAEFCVIGQSLAKKTLNSQQTMLYANIVTDYLGGTENSTEWTRECRSLLVDFMSSHDAVKAYLGGTNPIVLDAVDAVYNTLPYVLVSVLIAGMIMLGLMYKSVLIPLRALISIGVTLVFSFSISIGIYQIGWMNGFPGGKFDACGGLTWMNPAMAFCIILGLSLDYDIFLVGRIVEFRMLGFTDQEAIQLGLWKTGSVITSAGFIMAVAFSGLMLSNVPMLNQFSVFLVTAVVLDTFIVRPLIVPPIMSAFGKWNWMPRKMPSPETMRISAEDYVARAGARH